MVKEYLVEHVFEGVSPKEFFDLYLSDERRAKGEGKEEEGGRIETEWVEENKVEKAKGRNTEQVNNNDDDDKTKQKRMCIYSVEASPGLSFRCMEQQSLAWISPSSLTLDSHITPVLHPSSFDISLFWRVDPLFGDTSSEALQVQLMPLGSRLRVRAEVAVKSTV